MKKLILIAVLLFTTSQITFAQQAIAKIKFQEAEEAYAAEDYVTTLTKLREVETILKSTNPKTIYLRIMVRTKLIENNLPNNFNMIDYTITLCSKYLKDYENVPDNEDKYRDIYKISETLKVTLEVLNKEKEIIEKGNGTVVIGSQTWMQTNLNVDHYRNGDSIPQVQNMNDWANLKTGAWCYYENKTENGAKYGKLYNWYAVNDPRGLAPEGWHVPSDSEWKTLIYFLGGEEVAGDKMKALSGWKYRVALNNNCGFMAFPGGGHGGPYNAPTLRDIGEYGFWWSSSTINSYLANRCFLHPNVSTISTMSDPKYFASSVRCLKD